MSILTDRITGGRSATPLLLLTSLLVVDEFDRSAFNVLTPTIRDAFHLNTQGILGVLTLVAIVALGSQVFIGYYADRYPRLRIAALGAAIWGIFTLGTGIAPTIVLLVIARSATGIGRAVNDPTHNSLLADYYPPEVRTSVYGFHRAGPPVGLIIGPLAGGALSYFFGWRVPFLVFWIPTAVLVVLVLRMLDEPVRGEHERRAMGATGEVATTEETPPSFAEGWRICTQVLTLRRIFYSLPFLAAALLGISALTSIFYRDVFHMNDFARGVIGAAVEPFQLVGILVGIPIAARLARRGPGNVLRFLAVVATIGAVFLVAFALSPNFPLAVAANVMVSAALGLLIPGIYSTLSLVIPPRARGLGFAIGSLYIMIGVPVLLAIGGFADSLGIRKALLILVPIFLAGAYILSSAGTFVASDIEKVRASATAQAEVLAARRAGRVKLLLVKDLDVAYDTVQVLFKVNFEVDEGEIIALLGTNGAGKSTLLRAISGLQPAIGGAVVFDGIDMTYAPPQEVASRGVVQVPGGKGVFPTLTVEENLKIAGWLYRRETAYVAEATEQVLKYFPVLRERWDQPAGNLSGGEQQMLTLGQAFIARPRLLMIDELSLGLAPIIVEQLLEIVKAIRDSGTTIILVEQSVNVALTVAQTAFFMEKGEIRFKGPTAELLARPDILRSVFLEGAGTVHNDGDGDATAASDARAKSRTKTRERAVAGNGHAALADGPVVLESIDVVKRFGGITATNSVSFQLHQHEILGFIGPNGAGKTTLFDLISGYLPVDGGHIYLHGEDVTELKPDARARLGLGRSFQDARLFPALTVAETIALALERHVDVRDPIAAALRLPVVAESERDVLERVDTLIDLMGLEAFASKFVSELSTGSRRIVDLACVLAHQPSVILFDEPSSGIAQRETEALGPLLQRIRQSTSASLLVIEHDMPLITSISDRIVALDLGTVVTDGPPEEVVHHPQVVSAYLGTSEDAISRSGTLTAPNADPSPRRRRRTKEPA
jgi:ABC-type branched-subunit amino acid transport system ATPase component/predicted MFS family arabinose efflux permease